MENTKNHGIIVLIIVAIMGAAYWGSTRLDIREEGAQIIIKRGFQKPISVSKPKVDKYTLVVNNSFNLGAFSLFAWPIDTVHRLEKTYGDFAHCKSAGAFEAQKSLERIILLPKNDAVKFQMKAIASLTKNAKEPLVEITGYKLDISLKDFFKKKYNAHYDGPTVFYLVEDLKIAMENYIK